MAPYSLVIRRERLGIYRRYYNHDIVRSLASQSSKRIIVARSEVRNVVDTALLKRNAENCMRKEKSK
jgi:hypothetical protein